MSRGLSLDYDGGTPDYGRDVPLDVCLWICLKQMWHSAAVAALGLPTSIGDVPLCGCCSLGRRAKAMLPNPSYGIGGFKIETKKVALAKVCHWQISAVATCYHSRQEFELLA